MQICQNPTTDGDSNPLTQTMRKPLKTLCFQGLSVALYFLQYLSASAGCLPFPPSQTECRPGKAQRRALSHPRAACTYGSTYGSIVPESRSCRSTDPSTSLSIPQFLPNLKTSSPCAPYRFSIPSNDALSSPLFL